jgi:hypothetical protein
MRGRKNPPLDLPPVPDGAPLTFDTMARAYLEDYVLQRYRTMSAARPRVEHLRGFFGGWGAEAMTADSVRDQLYRRKRAAEAATIIVRRPPSAACFNWRSVAALLECMRCFPTAGGKPPPDGFFEDDEHMKVRAQLPTAYQDVRDFGYYSRSSS